MVVIFRMASILSVITGTCPLLRPAAGLLLGVSDLNMISFGKS